jgi:uncharacterized membrane protein
MQERTLRSAIYLVAGVGLLVSLFAAAEFFDASLRAVCSINGFFSCALVDQSGKTTTLGIQDYLWGIGGFVVILGVAGFAEKRPREPLWADALLVVTTLGVAASLYFLYVELAEIHALCPVCITAYLFGALSWVGAIALARRTRAKPKVGAASGDAESAAGPLLRERRPGVARGTVIYRTLFAPRGNPQCPATTRRSPQGSPSPAV